MATEKESIQEKVYGKQKIYFALQTDYDKLTSEELNALDDVGWSCELSILKAHCVYAILGD